MAQYTYWKEFNQWNVAPSGATTIGVYKSDGTKVGNIPLGNLEVNRGNLLYRVGLISDIHVDSQDNDNLDDADRNYWVGDEARNDLLRALNYFNNTLHVDMICSPGDIGLSNPSEELAYWLTHINSYSPNTPVYTCTGNHDVYTGNYGASTFKAATRRSGVEETEFTLIEDPNYQNSFYFCKTIGDRKDYYLFLSMYLNTPTSNPYLSDDLDWCDEILKKFKNHRVFLFTHYFFPAYAGNLGREKGAASGGMYGTSKGMGGDSATETKFMNMLSSYPNVIWFSGHSHWRWNQQSYQYNANIDRFKTGDTVNGVVYNGPTDDGAWTIHLPSNSSPIACTTYSSSNYSNSTNQDGKPAGSECAYMDVYENGVELVAINMNTKDEVSGIADTRNMVYLPIGNYWIDNKIQYVKDLINPPSSWVLQKNIATATGEETDTNASYAAHTDYILLTEGNKYYLTSSNIGGTASTYDHIDSITFYCYDSNKNYVGRCVGPSYCANGTANRYYYFDGLNQYNSDGDLIPRGTALANASGDSSKQVATVDNFNQYEITNRLFNDTDSDMIEFSGDVAYVRMRVQVTPETGTSYSDMLTQMRDEKWIQLWELNLTGISSNYSGDAGGNTGGGEEPIDPDPTVTYTVEDPLKIADIEDMATGDSKKIAIVSVARDAVQLAVNDTTWDNISHNGTYTNYGRSLSAANATANEVTLKNEVTTNVGNSPETTVFTLTKTAAGYTIQNSYGKYLGGTTATSASWSTTATDLTISNATGTSASSTIVSQSSNTKLLRITSDNNLYYSASAPVWAAQTGGWTLWYIYEISESTD